MTKQILPIVLSGGAGTRLWPESRQRHPKQLLKLVGDESMFLSTVVRASALSNVGTPLVVANAAHRAGIAQELETAGFADARLILEPIGRNTAPAVAAAALDRIGAGEDPLLLVLPADHVITDVDAFARAVDIAAALAEDDFLVTFGITPSHPETGYGYIEAGEPVGDGGATVVSFREKPDVETAARYVTEGHLWNSGMFLFRAQRYLDELEKHQPDVARAARDALAAGTDDGRIVTLDRDSLTRSPSISIDYAVMEPTENAAVVPLDAGWSDVGSWAALWDLGDADAAGNVIDGDAELLDVTDSYVRTRDRVVAVIGLDHVAIVDTPDATLVTRRDRAQDVKEIVDRLASSQRREVERSSTETRSWGGFSVLLDNPSNRVARVWIDPGAATSSRTHDDRSEYWIVVSGKGRITVGETTREVSEEDSVFIPAGEPHRLENASSDSFFELITVDLRRDEAGDRA